MMTPNRFVGLWAQFESDFKFLTQEPLAETFTLHQIFMCFPVLPAPEGLVGICDMFWFIDAE